MSEDDRNGVRERMATSRGVVVAAVLGVGTAIMANQLGREFPEALLGAVGVAAVFLYLLPRPLDMRSGVYAVFVPVAMTYGAVLEELSILILGAAAGAFFLFEKTTNRGDRGGGPAA